ncbi:hypothetical protein L4174_006000 [Photobacterium sp. CCB-ST2H9]|uniref:hypothetical protein n=1 Tax=Photobacterium sp. CCB-ST2H9 TaxID=2912855 RepID=UPI002003D57E|nr:hypothetical protein [Photobacterium sp. CCB-ST2H9]UTM58387.1 hypothetical protein L4174_006000 [Photobacterium sp. CCB-ST2H9]
METIAKFFLVSLLIVIAGFIFTNPFVLMCLGAIVNLFFFLGVANLYYEPIKDLFDQTPKQPSRHKDSFFVHVFSLIPGLALLLVGFAIYYLFSYLYLHTPQYHSERVWSGTAQVVRATSKEVADSNKMFWFVFFYVIGGILALKIVTGGKSEDQNFAPGKNHHRYQPPTQEEIEAKREKKRRNLENRRKRSKKKKK